MSWVQKEARDLKEVFHKLVLLPIQHEISEVENWVKRENEAIIAMNIEVEMEKLIQDTRSCRTPILSMLRLFLFLGV